MQSAGSVSGNAGRDNCMYYLDAEHTRYSICMPQCQVMQEETTEEVRRESKVYILEQMIM